MSRTHPTRHTPHVALLVGAVSGYAVALWFAFSLFYFALYARHRTILSPEEEFALENAEPEGRRAEAPPSFP